MSKETLYCRVQMKHTIFGFKASKCAAKMLKLNKLKMIFFKDEKQHTKSKVMFVRANSRSSTPWKNIWLKMRPLFWNSSPIWPYRSFWDTLHRAFMIINKAITFFLHIVYIFFFRATLLFSIKCDFMVLLPSFKVIILCVIIVIMFLCKCDN